MLIKKGKCISPVKTSSPKRVQSSNPFVEVFSPPARYDPLEPSIEVFAPSSQHRPSAPYRERKKSEKIKKKAYSGCGTGLYSIGLRALSSCGSTFLSCFAGRSHLLHCPPGDFVFSQLFWCWFGFPRGGLSSDGVIFNNNILAERFQSFNFEFLGTRFSPERGLCTWPASVSGCRL